MVEPLTVPEGMQAHRAGEPAGGMVTTAREISNRLRLLDSDSIAKKLGLDRASNALLGLRDARPSVIDCAAGCLDLVGAGAEAFGNLLGSWAVDRKARADGHQKALEQALAKPGALAEQQRLAKLTNVTLATLDLPGGAYEPTDQRGMMERFMDSFKLRYNSFWGNRDARLAAHDGAQAEDYLKEATTLREAADKLRDRTAHDKRVTEGALTKSMVEAQAIKTKEIEDKLKAQFQSVITEGAVGAKEAMGEVKQKDVGDVLGQVAVTDAAKAKTVKLGTS